MTENNTPFLGRMIGAAKLDAGIYEEVEHDEDATIQAAGVSRWSPSAQRSVGRRMAAVA